MKVWSEIQPTGGDFSFEPGQRYAVLASASLNYTLEQIESYAEGKFFQVTYAWQTGQPSRATYAIDDWLQALPPDTTSNHRWVYAEGNYGGAAAWTVGQDPPWPLTIYHLAHVFEAVDAPDPTPDTPDVQPALPTTSSSQPTTSTGAETAAVVVAVVTAVGLGFFFWRW